MKIGKMSGPELRGHSRVVAPELQQWPLKNTVF